MGQFYVEMTAEDWFQMTSRPFACPGEVYQAGFGEFTTIFDWIGSSQTISVT